MQRVTEPWGWPEDSSSEQESAWPGQSPGDLAQRPRAGACQWSHLGGDHHLNILPPHPHPGLLLPLKPQLGLPLPGGAWRGKGTLGGSLEPLVGNGAP